MVRNAVMPVLAEKVVAWMDRDGDWDVISDVHKKRWSEINGPESLERYCRPLYASPVVPVTREGIARIIDPISWEALDVYGQEKAAFIGFTPDSSLTKADTILAALRPTDTGWQDIATAPKDGTPVLGWCVHDADPYFIEPEGKDGRSRLTIYAAHTEGLSHVEDGAHVIVWGGSWDDSTHEYSGGWMPDWWFRADSEFDETANPTHWMPIPAAPIDTGREG